MLRVGAGVVGVLGAIAWADGDRGVIACGVCVGGEVVVVDRRAAVALGLVVTLEPKTLHLRIVK
jgi:hypothetical protein